MGRPRDLKIGSKTVCPVDKYPPNDPSTMMIPPPMRLNINE